MKLTQKLFSITSAGLMLLSVASPAFAGGSRGRLSILIKGNGADSDNKVNFSLRSSSLFSQVNETQVKNDIKIDAKTGENEANENTGGSVEVKSGDVTTAVVVHNLGSINQSSGDPCGCDEPSGSVKIKNNGADSDNRVDIDSRIERLREQMNLTSLQTDVDLEAETGENEANENTGETDSDPSVKSGDVVIGVEVVNEGGVNIDGTDVGI